MDFLLAILLLTIIVIAGVYWNEIVGFIFRKKNNHHKNSDT